MAPRQILTLGAQSPEPIAPTATHFRLLDLPKELRLIIYEQLKIEWKHHIVPLDDDCSQTITLVNPSLAGIRILATCRFVKEEAEKILRPRLAQMMQSPPIIIIEASSLPAVMDMRSSLSKTDTLLRRINLSISRMRAERYIHQYRSGSKSVNWLGRQFYFVPSTAVLAYTSFVLRAKAYKAKGFTVGTTPNDFPPIVVAVSIPADFTTIPFTLTTSRFARLVYKHVMHQPRQASVTTQADIRRIARRFAERTSWDFDLWSSMSVCVKVHFPDGAELYIDQKKTEFKFHASIILGLHMNAHICKHKTLNYGGVYRELEDGSPA